MGFLDRLRRSAVAPPADAPRAPHRPTVRASSAHAHARTPSRTLPGDLTPEQLLATHRAVEYDVAFDDGLYAAGGATPKDLATLAADHLDPLQRQAFHAGAAHFDALQDHALAAAEEWNELSAASTGDVLEAPDEAARRAIHDANEAAALAFAGPAPIALRPDGSKVGTPPAGETIYRQHYDRAQSDLAQRRPLEGATASVPAAPRRAVTRAPAPPELSL